MKLPVVAFTAFVAFATVNCHNLPDFGEGPLHEDIQYFLDFIPMKKVIDVVVQYAAEDAEFQKLLNYCSTQEFKTMVSEVEAIPEFHDFASYLQTNGVYVYNLLNALNKGLGIPPFQDVFATQEITGGLHGLFVDVKELINYDDFIHGYVYKMRTSDAFRGFVAHLKSEGHQKFVNALFQNERYVNFHEMLVQSGLDITLYEDVVYIVLGIEFPVVESSKIFGIYADSQTALSKDLHDFIDLIDKNQIAQIIVNHLEDDEVQRALGYMYGDEFHDLVRKVEALPEYQDLVKYLEDAGLDMKHLLQQFHKLVGMEDYQPPKLNAKQLSFVHTYTNLGGIKGLCDDVIAVLPLDKFKALYEEKMRDSPAFKNFMEKLQSPEFQKIVNTIYSSPIFLEMRQKAIDDGLDLAPVREIIEKMLGIHLPVPGTF